MKYFRKLASALKQYLCGDFLLARDVIHGDKMIKKNYLFSNIDEYNTYIQNETNKNFYEIISGIQRLYMDIDIKSDEKDIFDQYIFDLLSHIKTIYSDATTNVYTSHRPGKLSYHVLITNYYARDNTQCKFYIDSILKDFSSPLKPYIDMHVYKQNQLLRLLGCSKLNIDNTKVKFIGSDKFEDSLASYTSEPYTLLPYADIAYQYPPLMKTIYMLNRTQTNREDEDIGDLTPE